ncbi:hypothetical protein T492DRAFT_1100569 [Pavlovales sp. CCMP2436]|nr:hypothetical protein T492DRAFT_1100569 [Pavlovales sp. CCMP2436]|mmetsp:Transcript_11907/g.30032  ORF Transcript_11907/g.30032 Transcript_11907/m.30032 type:complete len:293 (-) Transcript_11907:153-1031(-)
MAATKSSTHRRVLVLWLALAGHAIVASGLCVRRDVASCNERSRLAGHAIAASGPRVRPDVAACNDRSRPSLRASARQHVPLASGALCCPSVTGLASDRRRARVVAQVAGTGPVPLLSVLNSSSKWLVITWQLAALALRRDLVSPFVVIGMVAASFFCSTLKSAIGHARPSGARADPGMPSSHALVSAFASTAWALELGSGAALGLGAVAASVGALRVVCGDHTWEQVAVGLGAGVACALVWMSAGVSTGLFALDSASRVYSIARAGLNGVCAVGILIFAVRKADKFRIREAR